MASKIADPNWRSRCYAQKFKTLEQRFMEKVLVDPVTGCWMWQACHDRDGYGFIRIDGKNKKAHRVALKLFKGVELADDDLGCHSCDTPACCNPDHVSAGTSSSNQIESVVRGRHYSQKLTEDQVVEMRILYEYGATQRQLANFYGVGETIVCNTVNRKKWKHVA